MKDDLGYFKCDICQTCAGAFNPETGNHVMCERIAELEAALNDAAQRAHAHAQYLGKKYHTGFSFRECTNECCQNCAELLKGGQDDNGA